MQRSILKEVLRFAFNNFWRRIGDVFSLLAQAKAGLYLDLMEYHATLKTLIAS